MIKLASSKSEERTVDDASPRGLVVLGLGAELAAKELQDICMVRNQSRRQISHTLPTRTFTMCH